MADVQNRNPNETSGATDAKKRKGFFSKVFGRSSNATEEDGKKKPGFMNSFKDNARQAVTKEVTHVAAEEGRKEVEKLIHENSNNNNGGSQSNNMPDTTAITSAPSEAVNSSTSWAKNMVGNAKQKMQGLQQSLA